MGKQQIRRRNKKTARINPLSNRAAAGANDQLKDTLHSEEAVIPVIQKLSSPDPSERAWAAACISNLIVSGPSVRKLLYSKGIVPLLLERLTDNQREVLEESLGVLRNLVAVDPSVASDYYSRDILTPLSHLIPRASETIDSILQKRPVADQDEEARRRTVWDFAENLIYLIWSLSEASDKYIKAINRLNIVPFLISFLSYADQCPTKLVVAAGQCLTTLTDDNKDIYIEFQNHPEYAKMLYGILDKFKGNDRILVQVLACSILMNVREALEVTESWEDDAQNQLNQRILPILVASLDYNIHTEAEKIIAALQSGNVNKDADSMEIAPTPKQALTSEEEYIEDAERHLSTLQLSLELLSTMCIVEDGEDDGWESADEDMVDEEGDEEGKEVTDENVDAYMAHAREASKAEALSDTGYPAIHTFVNQVFPHLIRLATPTSLSFKQEDKDKATVTQAMETLHLRALECLNNFLLTMNEVSDKVWFREHTQEAFQTWRWLFETANGIGSAPKSDTLNEVIETIVGCLWSLGRGLGQETPIAMADVTTLCGAFQATSSEALQVKIIGCLGPIAARQGHIEMNKELGSLFLQVVRETKQVAVMVEALNCLYDVYSDCAFDYDAPVFVQGQFLDQLRQALPSVRARVKTVDRRKNFDLRSRGDEAVANLVAFIKYKKEEQRH